MPRRLAPIPSIAARGAGLRAIRTGRGMSQEDVQRKTGISKSTLHAIEHGCGDPCLTTLDRLAELYGFRTAGRVLLAAERLGNAIQRRSDEGAD